MSKRLPSTMAWLNRFISNCSFFYLNFSVKLRRSLHLRSPRCPHFSTVIRSFLVRSSTGPFASKIKKCFSSRLRQLHLPVPCPRIALEPEDAITAPDNFLGPVGSCEFCSEIHRQTLRAFVSHKLAVDRCSEMKPSGRRNGPRLIPNLITF